MACAFLVGTEAYHVANQGNDLIRSIFQLGVSPLGVGGAKEKHVHEQGYDGNEENKAHLEPRWCCLKWMTRPSGSADDR